MHQKMNELDSTSHLRLRRLLDLMEIAYSEDGEDLVIRRLLDILENRHMKQIAEWKTAQMMIVLQAAGVGIIVGYLIAKAMS